MTEKITHNGKLYAIIVGSDFKTPGIKFFTPDEFGQQLGYMNRPAGYTIEPHTHTETERTIAYSQEVLFIRSGKLNVDLYDEADELFTSRVLVTGDVILLAAGGHGFTVLEDTEMIEVKQGPFIGEEGKVMIKETVCSAG